MDVPMRASAHIYLVACIFLTATAPSYAGCNAYVDQNEPDKIKFSDPDNSKTIDGYIACLSAADPIIRDEYAYMELSRKLRNDPPDSSKMKAIYLDAVNDFRQTDITAYHRSFLTLALSEIARVDRFTPFLSEKDRQFLVDTSVSLLTQSTDLTGFDPDIGYVHQIAHAADLVLQLSLNKAIDSKQLRLLSQATKAAINPDTLHFYHYGEPDRLVRASVYLMVREELDEAYWQEWLNDFEKYNKAPWNKAYQTNEGLAALHNTQNYLNRLLLWSYNAKNERLTKIHDLTLVLLKKVR